MKELAMESDTGNDPALQPWKGRVLPLHQSDIWSWQWDLNPQQPDYKSGPPPIEICQQEVEEAGFEPAMSGVRQTFQAKTFCNLSRRPEYLSAMPPPHGCNCFASSYLHTLP